MPRGRKASTGNATNSTPNNTSVKFDRHGNEKSNSKVDAVQIKAKKLIDNTSDAHITAVAKKKGRPHSKVKHVLPITDWLYITCDSRTWKLVEVVDKVNPKTGEKYPDRPLTFCTHLNEMIESCVHHMLLVPDDIQKLNNNFNHVYALINERIPANIKPKDLFKDIVKEEEDFE